MRLFLGIPISREIQTEVERQIGMLRDRLGNVRWAKPENLHFTLHFFGNVDEWTLPAAANATAKIAEETPPFTLRLDSWGKFSRHGKPEIIWIGGHNPELVELAERCQSSLRDSGFSVEERELHLHCTVGRIKRWTGGELEWWQRVPKELALPPAMATAMTYFESATHHDGPIYRPLITQHFGR